MVYHIKHNHVMSTGKQLLLTFVPYYSFLANLATECLTFPNDLDTTCSTLPPPVWERSSVGVAFSTSPVPPAADEDPRLVLEPPSCTNGKPVGLPVADGLPSAMTRMYMYLNQSLVEVSSIEVSIPQGLPM